MSSQLPIEIMIEILARLPAKSLVRFTIVCKLWFSIITTPNFITTHLNRFTGINTAQLLLKPWSNDNSEQNYLLLPDIEMIKEMHTELAFPLKDWLKYFDVVGSCNGLVCLQCNVNSCAQPLIIWNLSIRKWATLPLQPRNLYFSVIGFGFASEKSEYKIVRITYGERSQDQIHLNWFRAPLKVYLNEQGREKWRLIGCTPPHYSEYYMTSQVFIDGAVHWLALDRAESNNMISVFDMGDEVFKEIALPPNLEKHNPKCLSVELYKGSLGILYVGESGSKECSLWAMKNYGVSESWTNLYNILLPDCFVKTLGFRERGEILFRNNRGEIVSYNSETKTITNIGYHGRLVPLTNHKIHSYTESLVLLTRENLKRKQGYTRMITRSMDTGSNNQSKKKSNKVGVQSSQPQQSYYV